MRLGRTTDYGHTLNLTYNLPISKLPGLDWVNVTTRYGTTFNWKTEPLATLKDPDINLGNSIQNTRITQVNPSLNLSSLYNKFGFIRRGLNDGESGWQSVLLRALTSIKNIGGAYTRTEGTFLPGYLPKTSLLGQDMDADAPGWGFLFGSQRDIRPKAISNGWISDDPLLNQQFVKGLKEDLNLRSTVELVKDLRIELTALRSKNFNYNTTFKYVAASNSFENLSPITSGDYSISFFSFRTAFKGDQTALFNQLEANKAIVSQRFGAENPNSVGQVDGFADGYGKSSPDVVVASFIAAYIGKDARNVSLGNFPKIPAPNWRLNYNGLSKIPFLSELFSSIDINHGYRSVYSVNQFNSLARYQETNGAVSERDANNNFLPRYQFSQITLFEQFVPLLGIDMRLKNNMTTNFEYRKSRTLSLSLANSQLAMQTDAALVFGIGYRTNEFRFPFGLFRGLKLDNDLNFKFDLAINDRKTVIYRADIAQPEVSSGAKNITYRPSVDYVLNQRFNLKIFWDGNITKPYTSQSFNTSFSNFGATLRFTIQ